MTKPTKWPVMPTLSMSPKRKQNCGITSGFAGGLISPETTLGWNAAMLAIVKSTVGFQRATTGYRSIGV